MSQVLLLDAVVNALDSSGVTGGTTGWSAFAAFMPEDPDQVVVVFESPSPEEPEHAEEPTGVPSYEFPAFQIQVRAGQLAYDVARAKLQDVMNTLNNTTMTGIVYVFARDSAVPLGYDGNSRPLIAQTYNVMRELPDTAA